MSPSVLLIGSPESPLVQRVSDRVGEEGVRPLLLDTSSWSPDYGIALGLGWREEHDYVEIGGQRERIDDLRAIFLHPDLAMKQPEPTEPAGADGGGGEGGEETQAGAVPGPADPDAAQNGSSGRADAPATPLEGKGAAEADAVLPVAEELSAEALAAQREEAEQRADYRYAFGELLSLVRYLALEADCPVVGGQHYELWGLPILDVQMPDRLFPELGIRHEPFAITADCHLDEPRRLHPGAASVVLRPCSLVRNKRRVEIFEEGDKLIRWGTRMALRTSAYREAREVSLYVVCGAPVYDWPSDPAELPAGLVEQSVALAARTRQDLVKLDWLVRSEEEWLFEGLRVRPGVPPKLVDAVSEEIVRRLLR